jgi:hypothetical protein
VTGLQTEFDFFLPKGFVDDSGTVHREGTMRLATARDELDPLRDPRVRDADDPFLTIIVLSRVVTRLGSLSQVTPREVEGLFAADLAYLQDVYGAINFGTADDIADVIDDARERADEARTAARRPAPAPPARTASATVVDDVDDADVDADDETGTDDELASSIDAEALAARLQAQFGEQRDEDDLDEVVERPSRRRHIEEVTSRHG